MTGSQEPPQHSQRNLEVSWKPPSALEEQHGCDGQLGQVTLPARIVKSKASETLENNQSSGDVDCEIFLKDT